MKNASLKDFRYIRVYANWPIVILAFMVAFFNMNEKSDFSIESLKFKTIVNLLILKDVSRYIHILFDDFRSNIGVSASLGYFQP